MILRRRLALALAALAIYLVHHRRRALQHPTSPVVLDVPVIQQLALPFSVDQIFHAMARVIVLVMQTSIFP